METAIILLGGLVAVAAAVVFFGVFEKEKRNEFNMTEISSISRAESVFDRLVSKDGACTAIYIGMFYQSLYINADSGKFIKTRLSAEKKIKELMPQHQIPKLIKVNNVIEYMLIGQMYLCLKEAD